MDVKLIIGLEVHVELDTASKMFCACSTSFGAPPNSNVCPVCMGMPGSLPVMNRKAYEYSVRAGLALNCTIAGYTKWDRKNYYYPDLPKNYQISQYDLPLAENGFFEFEVAGETKRVRILRAHLEEDAGKLLHEGAAGTQVDLNRAGTPLLEIVTEPDFRSAQEAGAFARELRNTLRYVGVSHCDMQKGQMRFEPNINLHITADDGQVHKTPICEVKNLNSFRALEGAIAFEQRRQLSQWQSSGVTEAPGNKVNRGWDEATAKTVEQRKKEEADDYRYFLDPDLVPVELSDARIEQIRSAIGELPIARRRRFIAQLGLDAKDAATLVEDKALSDYFDAVVERGSPAVPTAKWVLNEVTAHCNEADIGIADFAVAAERLAALVELAEGGDISKAQAREIFTEMLTSDKDPADIRKLKGFGQITDESALESVIDAVLAANPKAVEAVKAGKQQAIGPMIGQVKKQEANANPKLVREMLLRRIEEM